MSSKEINSEGEIRACEIARERGIPYGFYADTYGAVTGRPQFTAALKEGASFLFVRNQTEADRARGHFPRSVIVVSGNVMQEDWFYPTATYEDVRRKMDVAPRELAVLCPSGKELVVNLIHFGAAIEAAKICRLERRMDMRVFLAIHPGDPKENYEHYLALARFSQSVPDFHSRCRFAQWEKK
ncbi:MAG: hypothetical protein HYS74_00655 [Parcubacteria group bacterium]|nr:hypothetical protein [Parcubacteria group bacterium]